MKADGDSFRAFLGWCVAGAGGCFGVLSLLSVGPFVLLGTLFLCAWLLWVFDFGWAMGGLLSGAALPLLYLAWLNRDGPGEVCTTTPTSQSCGEQSNPWFLLVAAFVLMVAGIAVFARRRRG
ncbi:MAG TPA: LPXTG cell wall anchor domain-containing protein [Nocardioides sp.]|uniref:LPXTG cell wall anchor domain-containing protein n=1 Tax=Nocardioides sp. TaxID=35761 RepID=UPI002F3E391A